MQTFTLKKWFHFLLSGIAIFVLVLSSPSFSDVTVTVTAIRGKSAAAHEGPFKILVPEIKESDNGIVFAQYGPTHTTDANGQFTFTVPIFHTVQLTGGAALTDPSQLITARYYYIKWGNRYDDPIYGYFSGNSIVILYR